MSQSPLNDEGSADPRRENYLNNWNALADLIRRGHSFSGRERNCCFLNTGLDTEGGFADVSAAIGLDQIEDGRGLALVDWDHDGDLDLWLANRSGPRVRLMINHVPRDSHYLTIQLQGTQCNRDAIGARVEIDRGPDEPLIVETVRAGEGFLSQSSKVLHVGLGAQPSVQEIRVRWPGDSKPQKFVDIQPDCRYLLIQGDASAKRLADRHPISLTPGELPAAETTDAARIVLTQSRPLPELTWQSFDGVTRPLQTTGRATLLNLWASWCKPCLEELTDLSEHAAELDALGVEVRCLNVESDSDGARQVAENLKLPFPSGMATPTTLRDLTLLDREILYRYRPLPLPCSFLVDAKGDVLVVYKGRVEVTQLMADARLADESLAAKMLAAAPFEGTNVASWFAPGPVNVARAYLQGGYVDDALRELREFLAQPISMKQRIRALRVLADVGRAQGNDALRRKALERLVEIQPESVQAKLELAVALHQSGYAEESLKRLGALERSAKQDPDFLLLLGQTYMRIGSAAIATHRFQAAAKAAPDDPEARFSLAMAYQVGGDVPAAIKEYERLLKSHPERIDAANNFAWLLATDPSTATRRDEAVEVAREVCRRTAHSQPAFLDTLAQALASAGQRQAAAQVLRDAIPIARGRGEHDRARKLSVELKQLMSHAATQIEE